eukprot:scaffold41514_cov60-Phaeocystis_antarctica.AAC.2
MAWLAAAMWPPTAPEAQPLAQGGQPSSGPERSARAAWMPKYHDGGVELSAAHDCLEKKCPAQVAAVQANAAPEASAFRKKRRALRGNKEAEL